MKRIIIEEDDCTTIRLSDVNKNQPIFAKLEDEPVGRIVNEVHKGWILRIGGDSGATGHHPTLNECIRSCCRPYLNRDYEFFV